MSARLDMIGLVCRDMAESIRFYRLLGLNTPDLEPDDPYIECKLESGLRISWNDLDMVKKIDPGWAEPTGQRIGLAFLCNGPAGVDAKYEEILAAGFVGHKPPWDALWGQRYAQVMDPDGNVIDLFAPIPQ